MFHFCVCISVFFRGNKYVFVYFIKSKIPVNMESNHANIIGFHKESFVSLVASCCVSCQKHYRNLCKPSHLVTVMFSLEFYWSGGFSDWYLLSKRRMCFEFLNVNILLPLFCQLWCLPGILHHSFSQDVPLKSLIVTSCGRNLVIGVYFHNAWLPLVRLNVQRNDNIKMILWMDYVSLTGHNGYSHSYIHPEQQMAEDGSERGWLFFFKKKMKRWTFLLCPILCVKY